MVDSVGGATMHYELPTIYYSYVWKLLNEADAEASA